MQIRMRRDTPSAPRTSSINVRRKSWGKQVDSLLTHIFIVVAAVAFTIPFAWLFLSSLKTNSEFRLYPISIFPVQAQWNNYVQALTVVPFFTYAGRSLILASVYTVLVVSSSAFVGFGFARHKALGKNFLFTLMLSTLMVPSIVTIIPQFILYSRLGITNTYIPWLLWGISGSPFHIFLFRQFFAGFPKELEDAAEVDGANRFRTFWQIYLPNAGPVIAATSIFAFQWVWGDYFLQSIFLTEQQATLAMKLATAYNDPRGQPIYTLTLAGVIIYVLPLIVTFFLAQRHIVRGIVTTGLK